LDSLEIIRIMTGAAITHNRSLELTGRMDNDTGAGSDFRLSILCTDVFKESNLVLSNFTAELVLSKEDVSAWISM
jgi:hypothetical protein